MTDTIVAQGVLLVVPTATVMPNPANPRRDADTIDPELLASIRQHGLIHPPVVRAVDHTGMQDVVGRPLYELLAGHRRLAHCVAAGLTEIPVILREDVDDEQALEILIVENLARKQLAPLEEAAGYEALRELGLSQRQIADKVGVAQPTVSKRLSLLKLPEKARAAVDSGGITLDEGHALARVPADTVEKLFGRATPPSGWDVRQTIRDHEIVEKRAKAAAHAAEAGLTLIDVHPASWLRPPDGPNGDHPIFLDAFRRNAELDLPEGHDLLPCHAAHISYAGELELVCTDPQSHRITTGAATADDGEDDDEGGSGGPDAYAERRAEREAAAERQRASKERRLEHTRAVIHRLGRWENGDPIDSRVWMATVESELAALVELAAWVLPATGELGPAGLDIAGLGWASWDDITPAWHRYVGRGTNNQARALLAIVADLAEDHMQNPADCLDSSDVQVCRAWLEWLVDHGYELDPDEQDIADLRTDAEAETTVAQDGGLWIFTCTNCDNSDPLGCPTEEAASEAAAAHLINVHGQPDTRQTTIEEAAE